MSSLFDAPADALRHALVQPCATRAPVVLVHAPHRTPSIHDALATLDDTRVATLSITSTTDPLTLAHHLARAFDNAVDARDQLGPILEHSGTPAFVSRVTGRDGRLRVFEAIRRFLGVLAGTRRTVLLLADVQKANADVAALVRFLEADALGAPALAGAATVGRRAALVLTTASDSPDGRKFLAGCDPRTLRLAWSDPRAGQLSDLLSPEVTARLGELVDSREHGAEALIGLLPRTLDDLYGLRLSQLPTEAHRALYVLDHAACPIPLATLVTLAQADRFSVERLRNSGLVVDQGGQLALPAWAAAAPVTLDAPTRAALDLQIASHLEHRFHATGDTASLLRACELWTRQRGASATGPRLARLAIPVDTLVVAALDLARRGATAEAQEVLTRALGVVAADETRPIHLALADIAVDRGDIASALSHVRDAAHDDSALVLRLAKLESATGGTDRAIELLRRLDATCTDGAVVVAVRSELAEVHLRRGELDAASSVAADALVRATAPDLSQHGGLQSLVRELEHTVAKIAFWRGDYPNAVAQFEALLATLPREEARLRALVAHNLGLVGLRTGAYDDAARRLQVALHGFERQGDHFEAAVCLHNLGIAYEHAQRYSHAAPMFERSIDLFERFGTAANLVGAVTSLADLHLTIGETWRARRLLEHARVRATSANLPYFQAFATLRLAAVAESEGDLQGARAFAVDAREAFATLGHNEELAESDLLLGQLGDADALARAVGTGSSEIAALAKIIHARSAPNRARATALLESAIEALERLGQRTSAARAHAALAVVLSQGGQRRAAEHARDRAQTLIAAVRDHVPVESQSSFDALPWIVELATLKVAPPTLTATPAAIEHAPHGLVGQSAALARVRAIIERVAPTSAPVLITGESGTGKELAAEAIWRSSPRHHRPLVRVNAAAFVDTLLESELFGHEKGAFTGATGRKLGAFEQANGGTLFLDEIGDISHKTQVSLLRVLQNGDIRRVGGTEPVRVDVRIICATNRDLSAMVAAGTFRLDLYYRIRGVELSLPALRDRTGDVDLLTDHVLHRLASEHGRGTPPVTLETDARTLLTRHSWPGNVRELENVIRSAFFFARDGRITATDLLTYTTLRDALSPEADADFDDIESDAYPSGDGAISGGFDLNEAKRKLELRCIERALEQAGGNISKAAQLLGLKRPRLSQKIKEYGLKEPG